MTTYHALAYLTGVDDVVYFMQFSVYQQSLRRKTYIRPIISIRIVDLPSRSWENLYVSFMFYVSEIGLTCLNRLYHDLSTTFPACDYLSALFVHQGVD